MTTPLTKLQKSMIEKNIAYYLIPSEDPHQSEYVDAHTISAASSSPDSPDHPEQSWQNRPKAGSGRTGDILPRPKHRSILSR